MTRVFLDANILFSAAHRTSILGRLILEARRRVALVCSDGVIEEARRNLAAKRPDGLPGLDDLLNHCENVPDAFFPLDIRLTDSDRMVLCTAINANCQYLLTGDKRDFGPYFGRTIQRVTIVSTRQMADVLKDIPPRRTEA